MTRPIYELAELVRKNVAHIHEVEEDSVDVGFVRVRKTPEFDITPEQFIAAIEAAEEGEFQQISLDRLKEGPSYIEIGAWIGSQTLALEFMGLGAILGLWKIVTPGVLGIEGDQAQQMMGMGFLMISGLQR